MHGAAKQLPRSILVSQVCVDAQRLAKSTTSALILFLDDPDDDDGEPIPRVRVRVWRCGLT